MAWSGIVGIVILLIGQWAVAHFVPPPSPSNSIHQTVAIYTQHHERIQVGLVIAIFGAVLLGPWTVAIATQMRRVEGGLAPLSRLQLMFGCALVLEFLIPVMMWQAAAFRPTLDPVLTYRLHDLGSITYIGLPVTASLQAVALGAAILQGDRARPAFPRWLAYLSFAAAVAYLPGAVGPAVHSGPFAWNGFLSWWLGLAAFGIWIAAVTWALLARAIPQEQALEQDVSSRSVEDGHEPSSPRLVPRSTPVT
jgi:hypothetical protein